MKMMSIRSTLFFALVTVAVTTFAAPVDEEETHYLGKRDTVCAQDFRAAFDADDCLNGPNFALTPPSTITETAKVTTKPAASQCDHTVEIQFLDGELKKSGVCTVLQAMVKVDKTKTLSTQLNPMADIINGKGNLLFLDASVNNRKKTFISNIVKGNPNPADALDTAVESFLTKSKTNSIATVKQLDTKLAAIITTAKAVAAANPVTSTARRLPPADVPKKALIDAIAALNAPAGLLLTTWEKVVG